MSEAAPLAGLIAPTLSLSKMPLATTSRKMLIEVLSHCFDGLAASRAIQFEPGTFGPFNSESKRRQAPALSKPETIAAPALTSKN